MNPRKVNYESDRDDLELKPEKDKVNIYENDEAYMLNDDKDNLYSDEGIF